MSLGWYVRPRIVALKSTTSVLDSARAIEQDNIGAALPFGPDKPTPRASIEQGLARQPGVEPSPAAKLLAASGAVSAQSVSSGRMEDVRSQLPEPLRDVFPEAPAAAAS
jgi:hypothetical protein